MVKLEDLKELEKTFLLSIAWSNNFSLRAHKPEKHLFKRLPKDLNLTNKIVKKKVEKSFRSLITKGLIVKHPTKNNITYQLSKNGLKLAYLLKDQI